MQPSKRLPQPHRSPVGVPSKMKYVVYIPEEKKIVPCEKEDFFSEELCAVECLDDLTGSPVLGACICGEDLYTKCYLLQVVSDDFVKATLKFLHRVFFEKTKSEEKRVSLATFNLLSSKRPSQRCIEVAISRESIQPCPIVQTKQEPKELEEEDSLQASKRARLSLPFSLMSPVPSTQDDAAGPSVAGNTPSTGEGLESSSATLFGTTHRREQTDERVGAGVTAQLLYKVHDRLKDLSEKLDRLERSSFVSEPVKLNLPLFIEEEDFMQTENLSAWMLQQGGANLKDFVYRCLSQLIAPQLQLRVNRSGKFGKLKFPPDLEAQLKESAIRLFPNCTTKDTEHAIVRFFHNSADRHGQRERRKSQQRMNVTDFL